MNRYSPCSIVVVFFLYLLFSTSAFCEETSNDTLQGGFSGTLWNYLTDGASVTVGIGGRSIATDVTRLDTTDHGKMIEHTEDALFLIYNTKASYVGTSDVGYGWLFNASTFHLREQELTNQTTINLGTEVEGYFAYVVPTIFYNFGDRHRGHFLRTGIGLGIGLAEFTGNVVLTESLQANDRVNISNGPSNIFSAFGIFIDYQWNNFTLRLASAGPNLIYNGYRINVSDASLMLGFTYYLDD